MENPISVVPDRNWETTLDGGRRITIRPCRAAEHRAIEEFAAGPGAHFLARPAHCLRQSPEVLPFDPGSLAFVALTPDGFLLGAAWIENVSDGEAQLAVVVQSAIRQTSLARELVSAVGREARALNIRRLKACVLRDSHDPLTDFRAAGARVSSSICLGGVSDVVLDLE